MATKTTYGKPSVSNYFEMLLEAKPEQNKGGRLNWVEENKKRRLQRQEVIERNETARQLEQRLTSVALSRGKTKPPKSIATKREEKEYNQNVQSLAKLAFKYKLERADVEKALEELLTERQEYKENNPLTVDGVTPVLANATAKAMLDDIMAKVAAMSKPAEEGQAA